MLFRSEVFFGVIHGKFSVACVLVRIVFDYGDIDVGGHFERVEITQYDVGVNGAYTISAVATKHLVGFDFSLDLCSMMPTE